MLFEKFLPPLPQKKEGKDQQTKPQETRKSGSTYAEAARRNTHRQENV